MKTRIAVLIPCLNEEMTIGKVVRDFREQLPDAAIHVFDNSSTDCTRQAAEDAGAIVHREQRRAVKVLSCRPCSSGSTPTSTSWSMATTPTRPTLFTT